MTLNAVFNGSRNKDHRLKFLDFGMAWGDWCFMANAFGIDSYGIEFSESKVNYAQSRGIKVISMVEINQHKFDFINTEQVFEHISTPLEVLALLRASLSSNGLIKISVPNGSGIIRKIKIGDFNAPKNSRNSLNPVAPLEHINCFRRISILKMAHIAGLEIVKIPIHLQLSYTCDWSGLKRIVKNILRPIYRNMSGTYLFFRKINDSADDQIFKHNKFTGKVK